MSWRKDPALTVVLAAKGYPGDFKKGSHINGLSQPFENGVQVFHAGTALDGEALVANGGRVLNVTALGSSVKEAQAKAYRAVDQIDWPEGFCRRDIGWRAISLKKMCSSTCSKVLRAESFRITTIEMVARLNQKISNLGMYCLAYIASVNLSLLSPKILAFIVPH